MLALFLFAVVEEDVDEFTAAAVDDIEVLTALGEMVVAAEAAALQAAWILFCLLIIDLHSRKAEWISVICQIL